ncbi:MAG: UvrD-helicase domain-containing protein, partial [Desulfosarcina sp.]
MNLSPIPTFDSIDDIHAVDLSRHALVEASAGTGKTYTLENLVIRLLKEEPDIDLENILLVTFTEKATGELKLRIRHKIERILDQGAGLEETIRNKLSATLDGFDKAAITTIHGFCHRLLKEFPFETGNVFKQELIDDAPLLEKLLRVQMRKDWPKRYGHRLETLLALSDFSADADGFVRQAVNLAMRVSGDPAREILIPDPARLDLDGLWQSARAAVMALKALVGPPPCFSDAYGRLNINSRTRAAIIRDMVEPIERLLDQTDVSDFRLETFKAIASTLGARHPSGERNIDRLVPSKWLKAGENLHACAPLVAIRQRLDDLVGTIMVLSHTLTIESVIQLRQDLRSLKDQNGWISYQDMLTRVAEFATGDGADDGLRVIRARYRVAFVDEFQDTDELQWRIFRTFFLDSPADAAGSRLFLIGDPKQAIYGFRGADVFTYLGARQQIKTLAAKGLANLYELTVNWRSAPDMVDAFNRIFSQKAWFGTRDRQDPFQIGYTPCGSPDPDELRVKVAVDRSRRRSLNVMDLTTAESHVQAKRLMAGFICREIDFLVGEARIHLSGGSGGERAIHFADIAILVRSQSEFALIEPLLKESSIPYAYYRKPGLFQCREARWLYIVLAAVCHPEQTAGVNLALLTPFFDLSATALAFGELPAAHPAQSLLARWHTYAQRRQWGPLFQSLLEDSGLMLRHCRDSGWGRTQTNLEQIFDYLEASAYSRNLDMGGLVALLDSLHRSGSQAGSDADIHQIEDEGDKVQIMTMHVSKGLEFPVVFVAGGLTVRHDGGMHVYHVAD